MSSQTNHDGTKTPSPTKSSSCPSTSDAAASTPGTPHHGNWWGIVPALRDLMRHCGAMAEAKGFRNDHFATSFTDEACALKMALIASEAMEAFEEIRKPNLVQSTKIKGFSTIEEECADIFIRLLDFCDEWSLDLPNAVIAKIRYNETRPHLHGKAF